MKKTSKRGHSTMSELNITPLLDLVFVLLVIFIITTPQLVNNLEMTLPSGKPPPQTKQPKVNKILVDDTGQVFLNDAAYTKAGLKEELSRLKAADPENMAVVVNGSDDVAYQGMVTVLDVLQQLDITKVVMATH
jgi:biopolymer transport protein ExbD